MRPRTLALVAALSLTGAAPAAAATYTVTSTAADGAGSLAAAITAANGNAGADRIEFAVGTGAATIDGSGLPAVSDPVTVDGTTQPGPDALPRVTVTGQLSVGASGVTVQGLRLTDLTANSGTGLVVRGNVLRTLFLQTGTGATVGGTGAGDANIVTASAYFNGTATVQGNRIGLDEAGAALGADSGGAHLGGDVTFGGSAPGAGNLVAGPGSGLSVDSGTATVRGNTVGLGTGDERVAPGAIGISVVGGTGHVVQDNAVGGTVMGIAVNADGVVIRGNRVGLAPDGASWLSNSNGIEIYGSGNVIGGTAPGQGNTVVDSGGPGIAVYSGTGNTVVGNSVHDNLDQGIALDQDGVDVNDAGDIDTGANGKQNFPVLTGAAAGPAGAATVTGSLGAMASRGYAVDVYASAHCDVLNAHGEGERYLGRVDVVTGADGKAAFAAAPLAGAVAAGQVLTATATDTVTGSTSEFSACLQAGAAPGPALGGVPAGTTNGGIVYSQRVGDDCTGEEGCSLPYTFSLMYTSPDGSARALLTDARAGGFADFDPVVSPDGNWVAFTRCPFTCVSPARQVWIVRIDGTGARMIADNAKEPSWSPDGTKLIYAGSVSGDNAFALALVTQPIADGSIPTLVPVPLNGAFCYFARPHWFSAAQAAVHVLCQDDPYPYGLSAVDVNTGARTLDPFPLAELDLRSNPFDTSRDGRYVLTATGKRLLYGDRQTGRVSELGGPLAGLELYAGAWSPNGQKLAAVGAGATGSAGVYVLGADATAPVRITHDSLSAIAVTWQPCVAGVTATCAPPPPNTLTVTRAGTGAAGGSVTSTPAGIDCGATCSASFQSGTQVTLSAATDGTATFDGFSGACTGTDACTVAMDQARAVTATFTKLDDGSPGGGGGGGGSGKPTLQELASVPSTKRCQGNRRLRFSLRHPKKVASLAVTIGKRHITKRGAALRKPIVIRGLPLGTVKVKLRITLKTGVVVATTLRYRICS